MCKNAEEHCKNFVHIQKERLQENRNFHNAIHVLYYIILQD